MAVVIALISQKGGVGKSTLGRGLGAVLARAGLKVRIADLDPQQRTAVQWSETRRASHVSPAVDVQSYSSWREAIAASGDVELLVLDMPGHANEDTLLVTANAHLVVQPTGASVDDLYPGVLLFHELVAAGIDRRRLAFALCKVDSSEEDDARTYLDHAGYAVLPGSIPDQVGYRRAQNRGRAVTETEESDLNTQADALMLELLTRVATEIRVAQDRSGSSKSKTKRGSP